MKHFLNLAEWPRHYLEQLIEQAVVLKKAYFSGGNQPVLANKTLAMIFQKPSLRTRVSFEMAMRHLGGEAMYLGPSEIGLGKRESIGDVARVMSGYVHGVMLRVFDYAHLTEYASYSNVPIINGLSDYNHPCQAMADVLTMYEEFGRLSDLQLTYIGDSNNVARSLVFAGAQFGFRVVLCSPEGYQMDEESLTIARKLAGNDSIVELEADPVRAVSQADAIYTDTWVSMGQEEETIRRREVFPPYQVNSALLAKAPSHAIVLHCLPAHRGEEITDDVADGSQSRLFPQAHNRLHAQKAILVKLMA